MLDVAPIIARIRQLPSLDELERSVSVMQQRHYDLAWERQRLIAKLPEIEKLRIWLADAEKLAGTYWARPMCCAELKARIADLEEGEPDEIINLSARRHDVPQLPADCEPAGLKSKPIKLWDEVLGHGCTWTDVDAVMRVHGIVRNGGEGQLARGHETPDAFILDPNCVERVR